MLKRSIALLARRVFSLPLLLIVRSVPAAQLYEYEQSRKQSECLAKIEQITSRLRQHLDLDAVLTATVNGLGEVMDLDRARIALFNPDGTYDRIVDWTAPGVDPCPPLPPAVLAFGRKIAGSRQTASIGDVSTCGLDEATIEGLAYLGIAAVMSTPLVIDEEIVGNIVLHMTRGPREWTDDDKTIFGAVSRESSRAITHGRLYQKERELVDQLLELDRTKTDFVSSVSHELRTPLTSVIGYIEMLGDGDMGELSDQQQRTVEVIDRNTRRLLMLIEDLLTLSQIESGAFKIDPSDVPVQSLLENVLTTLYPVAESQGVSLDLSVDPSCESMRVDSNQLERALLNLVNNGIKFTPENGSVVVTARSHDDQTNITIRDTGIGIAPEDQPLLFTRFFRTSEANRRAITGTGLGLVITKSIVDNHGGTIDISSAPGEGTTITVTIPNQAIDADISDVTSAND